MPDLDGILTRSCQNVSHEGRFVAVIVKFTDTASYIKWLLWKLPLVRRDTKKKNGAELGERDSSPRQFIYFIFF